MWNSQIAASFECCLSSSPKALFPLKFIWPFCSSRARRARLRTPIAAKSFGEMTIKKPPIAPYYTNQNLVELKNIKIDKTDFWTTQVLNLFEVNNKDAFFALLKVLRCWKDTSDFVKLVKSRRLKRGTVCQIVRFISHFSLKLHIQF